MDRSFTEKVARKMVNMAGVVRKCGLWTLLVILISLVALRFLHINVTLAGIYRSNSSVISDDDYREPHWWEQKSKVSTYKLFVPLINDNLAKTRCHWQSHRNR